MAVGRSDRLRAGDAVVRASVTAGHLGGYVVGGDPPAMYPDLWEWLASGPEKIRSVLDVGCGDGATLDVFHDLGVATTGIDGIDVARADAITHDFTTGPAPELAPFDLVWSCEFVEHLDEQYLPNALPALCAGRLLALTHAVPGQPGWHHVNCRPADYWIEEITGYGTHLLDDKLTAEARVLAAHNPDPANYFAKTGLMFRAVSS